MRRPSRLSFCFLVVLVGAVSSCGDPQIRGSSPGGGNNAGGSGVNTERPGGGAGGSAGSGSTPTPAGGAGGGGFTLPDPPANPVSPPDAAPIQCASEAHKAEIVPLDLMLLVDASGSMSSSAGMRTKWETAREALRNFVADPKSAGLGMGLQFFPNDKTCTNDRDCSPTAMTMDQYCRPKQICAGPMGPGPMPRTCGGPAVIIIGPIGGGCSAGQTCQAAGLCADSGAPCTGIGQACPMAGGTCEAVPRACSNSYASECTEDRYDALAVNIDTLPMAQPALTKALNRKEPGGGTPMGPAIRSVLKTLQARQQANPGRKLALVLASDGLPGGCTQNDIPTIAMDLQAAFMATQSIPTYVIGVFSQLELARAQPQLDQLAMGGGTNKAFLLTAQDDLNMRLLEALNQIRGAALACEYRIPMPDKGDLDFGKVNVRYTSGTIPENIPYVERMDRCDPMRGGWYYDVHPSMGKPARVMVCPATCSRFKTEKSSQVELVFGCATQVIN